nr:MAG TPA: hypothetical protein [Bacteriophage sp.]
MVGGSCCPLFILYCTLFSVVCQYTSAFSPVFSMVSGLCWSSGFSA